MSSHFIETSSLWNQKHSFWLSIQQNEEEVQRERENLDCTYSITCKQPLTSKSLLLPTQKECSSHQIKKKLLNFQKSNISFLHYTKGKRTEQGFFLNIQNHSWIFPPNKTWKEKKKKKKPTCALHLSPDTNMGFAHYIKITPLFFQICNGLWAIQSKPVLLNRI